MSNQQSASSSPLAEAQPESLSELFARMDPTDEDIEKICERLRKDGARFKQLEEQPKKQKRVKHEGPVSLEDFGL